MPTDRETQNNVAVLAFLLLCLEICKILSYFKINCECPADEKVLMAVPVLENDSLSAPAEQI